MNASEFMKYENWVVAGDVQNESKYACKIMKSLQQAGFKVSGVNPRSQNAECVYARLADVPYSVEVIDLCINPRQGIDVVKEARKLNVKNILIQPGAESEEILAYCSENGMNAVKGCALVELTKVK